MAAMKVDIAELNHAEAFGALMGVFLWIYGILSPFAGIIAERVNSKSCKGLKKIKILNIITM